MQEKIDKMLGVLFSTRVFESNQYVEDEKNYKKCLHSEKIVIYKGDS